MVQFLWLIVPLVSFSFLRQNPFKNPHPESQATTNAGNKCCGPGNKIPLHPASKQARGQQNWGSLIVEGPASEIRATGLGPEATFSHQRPFDVHTVHMMD